MTASSGLLIVDKPAGWTSHDVVAKIRKLAGTKRVGHAGTLDPMATGVLVVGVERATRLLGYLTLAEKEYAATIRLGQATDTDDADGTIIGSVPVAAIASGIRPSSVVSWSSVRASLTRYGPTLVRRNAVRCPPTPSAAPRSRASARTYVPLEHVTRASTSTTWSAGRTAVTVNSRTVTVLGASSGGWPARASR